MAAKTGFVFRDRDIRRWHNFDDALVVIYHSWTTSMHFITELNPDEHIVKLAPPSTWPIGYWWEYNTRYHVENILEALDEPGEWYLDRRHGRAVLLAAAGRGHDHGRGDRAGRPADAGRASRASRRRGRFVEHLQFRGISFQHTDCLHCPRHAAGPAGRHRASAA